MLKTLLKLFPIYKYQVSGQSMLPALKHRQTVLVNTLAYLLNSPRTGDVVAVKDPRDGKTLIKRIAEVKDNKYFVLGDNKEQSTDSRSFGWIARNDIIGKVIYVAKRKSQISKRKTKT